MVFGPAQLISYISRYTVLQPGGRRPDRVAPGTDRSLAPVHQLSELVRRGAVGLVTIGV